MAGGLELDPQILVFNVLGGRLGLARGEELQPQPRTVAGPRAPAL